MFLELFDLFGWAWWLLIGGVSITLILILGWEPEVDIQYQKRTYPGRFSTAIVLVALLAWFFLGNLQKVFHDHFSWVSLAEYLGGYFVIGILWGLFKWDRKSSKRRSKYNDWKIAWLKQHGVVDATSSTVVPENLKDDWEAYIVKQPGWFIKTTVKGQVSESYDKTVPQRHIDPWDHKAIIAVWCAYWPWDALRYFLYDFLVQIWDWISTSLFRVMRKITAWRMSGTEKDFRV